MAGDTSSASSNAGYTAMHPRLVVDGSYVEGGCRGAESSVEASGNDHGG